MIHKREPLELSEQIMPRLLEAMQCLNCGHVWGAYRFIGTDYRLLECPFCAAHNTDLMNEAPRMWASLN